MANNNDPSIIKILMVDDDTVDQMAFKRLVRQENLPFDYTLAGSIFEARSIMDAETFDIMIFDYQLGDGTAFELFPYNKGAPIIVTTGAGNEELAVKAMKGGAYDYVIKDLERNYLKIIPVTLKNALKRKEAEEQIRMLTQAIMSINESVYITDMENEIIFVNEAFCKTYGYKKEDILWKKADLLWAKKAGPNKFRKTTASGWTNEVTDVRKDGTEFASFLSGSLIKNKEGENIAVIRVTRDITERKELEKALRRLSLVDGLTGIANRRNFDETLGLEWKRGMRNTTPLSLIMIDIDYFKGYNDRYGHQAGDICLKKIAGVIQGALKRPADLAARYGGEEFVVLLSETDAKGAVQFAESLRNQTQTLKIAHDDSSVSPHVTISLGISTILPNRKSSPDNLLSAADKALYQAKQKGRNRVETAA